MQLKRAVLVLLVVAGVIAAALPARACLWDYDTLAMERQQFPSALELITGKFLRHSPAFYEWRVQDRLLKMGALSDDAPLEEMLRLRDDLAVAYDKLGKHDDAIFIAVETLQLDPKRYESLANLGTFYIHNGELEKGLELIKQAIRINPDAHFGREKYQQYLVEYILYRKAEGDASLPLRRPAPKPGESRPDGIYNFADFILKKESGLPLKAEWKKRPIGLPEEQQQAAFKGMLGIMRFGNFQSPIVLEALADVMESGNRLDRSGRNLTMRARLRAEQFRKKVDLQELVTSDVQGKAIKGYRADVAKSLEQEVEQANEWYAQVEADEKRWIAEGGDVDAKFAAKYYREPEIHQPVGQYVSEHVAWYLNDSDSPGVFLLLIVLVVLLFVISKVRQRAKARHQQMIENAGTEIQKPRSRTNSKETSTRK